MVIYVLLPIIYIVLLFILLVLDVIFKIKIYNKYLLVMTTLAIIALSIIAFFTYPNEGTDLSRYYDELSRMERLGIPYLRQSLYYTTPITNYFFYAIARIGVFNLLPSIATLFIFTGISYVVFKTIHFFKIPNSVVNLYWLCLISVGSLRAMLTAVRQHWALSVLLIVIYFDFFGKFNNKFKLVLYIVPCLIHIAMVPYVALRIVFIIFPKLYNIRYVLLVLGLLIFKIITLASGIFVSIGQLPEYINTGLKKLLLYINIPFPDKRLLFVHICMYILMILCIIFIKRIMRDDFDNLESSVKEYFKYYEIILIFTFMTFPIQHLFDRSIMFVIYLSLPVLSYFYRLANRKPKTVMTYTLLLLIAGLTAYWLVDLNTSWRLIYSIIVRG